jgi:two-component system LytT family response regulator
MSALRVAIVDVEPLALQRLRRLVGEQSDLELVGEGQNGMEAVDLISSRRPDLVFLDVQMPELDGFGVLDVVGPEKMPAVVFVTAHDRYALKAFESNAVDFLLKPFDAERFQTALKKARRFAENGGSGGSQVSHLTQAVRRDRLVIRADGRYVMIKPREIEYAEAAGNYLQIHCGARTFTVRETMAAFESRLDSQKFVRIHRSTLINIDHVQELQATFHGEYVITMRGGQRVTLSRTYRSKLDQIIGQA